MILLLLTFGIFTQSTWAGWVNTEKLRSSITHEGFSGSVDTSIVFKRGNNDLQDLNLGLRLQNEVYYPRTKEEDETKGFRRSKSLIFLDSRARTGRQRSRTFVNNGFVHLRWTRMWSPRLGSEVFTQFEFNDFTKLKRRTIAGLGPRVPVLQKRNFRIYFGTSYMVEFERLDATDPVTGLSNPTNHRWNNYVSFKIYNEAATIRFFNTTYAQPNFSRFDDVRILNDSDLEFGITTQLSFGFSLNLAYDRFPPAGVQSTDTAFGNKIKFRF